MLMLSQDCSLLSLRPARPTLFPYTTLFRSEEMASAVSLKRTLAPQRILQTLDRHQTVQRRLAGKESRLARSEEHTSELQSLRHLVCRLLLEKKHADRRVSAPRTHIQADAGI